jgi:DNA invertase Pin-like site-specific DNA recombinase
MSKHHPTNGCAERAAALYRNSDDKQENSIARQQATVPPYAEKNDYQIVETYIFDSIPGDKISKDPRWLRLLQDAGKLWSVLLVDEPSRLSRDDPDYFVKDVKIPLKEAGVRVVSVANGPMDWETIAGDIITLVNAHQSREEVRRMSRRVLTEMARLARNRRILGAPPPYGYLTEYETISEPGKPPVVRPKRFILDPRKAHVVTWMFEQYGMGLYTMEEMAVELNRRGVEPPARKSGRPSKTRPRGTPCKVWTRNTVRAILKNPRYTGFLTWNRRSHGKYSRVEKGAVVYGKGTGKLNDRQEWFVSDKRDHEELCTQEMFDRVQLRMAANKGRASRSGVALFSGLLVCSHCGRSLVAVELKGKQCYRCKDRNDACEKVCGGGVNEEWLLDKVLTVIEQEVLAPERLNRLREEIRRQAEQERKPVSIDPLKIRLAELERHITQGHKNLAILPEDMVPHVAAEVKAMETERGQIAAELKRREGGGNLEGLEDTISVCEALLWRLREAVKGADRLLLRSVVRETISRIELAWEHRPCKKRIRHVLTGGTIYLRPQVDESFPYRNVPRVKSGNQ